MIGWVGSAGWAGSAAMASPAGAARAAEAIAPPAIFTADPAGRGAGAGGAGAVGPGAVGTGAGSALSPELAGGYTPGQIQSAYDLAPLFNQGIDGTGQTIAIVDPFGSPTIRHDLQVFDQQFGLSVTLRVIRPEGAVSPVLPTALSREWAAETTLDVEWAHVMAPGARILLAETPATAAEGDAQFVTTITKAVRYVINHKLASVISQSLDVTEQNLGRSLLTRLGSVYADARRHRVTVLAAAGDTGPTNYQRNGTSLYTRRVTAWPATDPLVTAVGGADVQLNAAGARTAPDTVWSEGNQYAGGGGRSAIFARPIYQHRVSAIAGSHRGIPDIAMSAGCDPGVDVYHSFAGATRGWSQACGTSEATPLLAGVVALADQMAGQPLGFINPALYQLGAAHSAGLVDIVKGINTVSFEQNGRLRTVPGFRARAGYDLASGLGTVTGALFVPELAAQAAG